jgi:hypothetical protein
MLDVANGPVLAEKSLKKQFLGKIPKKWGKSHPKKFFSVLLNQVEFFYRFLNTLKTVVKEFFTSETMRRISYFGNLASILSQILY